jgi:hypothetical protein
MQMHQLLISGDVELIAGGGQEKPEYLAFRRSYSETICFGGALI